MTIELKNLVRLAAAKHTMPCMRAIVFDGKSAICAAPMDWVAGVPCLQPALTEPVVVPVDAIAAHMAKSRHLIVMADHLSNGQGLTTPFNAGEIDYSPVLDMLPPKPEQKTKVAGFDLELDALDRVLIAAGERDIRYFLNGVLFDLTHGVLVGTNGHQLHLYRNRVPALYPEKYGEDGLRQGEDVELILPRDPLHWMLHSASQAARVTVFNPTREKTGDDAARTSVLIQADDAFVWVRGPIEGKFPDWQRVVPAVLSRPAWFELDPVKLADALVAMRRVVKLTGKGDHYGLLVDFGKGEVAGGADCPDAGALPFDAALHSDDAGLDLASLADDLWVGISPSYLQDMADCVTKKAQWRVDHSNMPNCGLMVVDGDFSGVVMPCRIGGPVKVAGVDPVALEPVRGKTPAQEAQEAQEEPETAPPEPCPAAVAAIAAQLVGKAQESAKKAPRKAAKAAKIAQTEPVAA